MDENYLDNLLNEFSLDKEIDHKIEDELDYQIQREKQVRHESQENFQEDDFNLDLERESSQIDDSFDMEFSEEQMDELDALDELADLDIGDLEFSDLDFDDIDMTNLENFENDDFDTLLKDFDGDFEIDAFFKEENSDLENHTQEKSNQEELPLQEERRAENDTLRTNTDSINTEDLFDFSDFGIDGNSNKNHEKKASEDTKEEIQINEDLNEDSFDADVFLDSLLEETSGNNTEKKEKIEDFDRDNLMVDQFSDASSLEELFESVQAEKERTDLTNDDSEELMSLDDFDDLESLSENAQQSVINSASEQQSGENLDDLLSLLGMEEETPDSGLSSEEPIEKNIDDAFQELPEHKTSKKVKEKKTIWQVLFGDDEDEEEDTITEEEQKEIEAKKEAKRKKKQQKKEQAQLEKEKKSFEDEKKKKVAAEKKRKKIELKKQKKQKELEDTEPEKKLNKMAVTFIFTFFLGGVFLFYISTLNFNYTQAIKKAADYFSRQKYRYAYDEIVGVEVKEKDMELKDRIYTVMYVERLYEAYQNNLSLGYEERALDSLLRGVQKYYEHYDEAEELGIVNDLDYSFQQIQLALHEKYGITVEQAISINALDNVSYVNTIEEYVKGDSGSLEEAEGLNPNSEDESPIQEETEEVTE